MKQVQINPGFCQNCGCYLRPDQGEIRRGLDNQIALVCSDCKQAVGALGDDVSTEQVVSESSLMAVMA